jgi:hypothetical protein
LIISGRDGLLPVISIPTRNILAEITVIAPIVTKVMITDSKILKTGGSDIRILENITMGVKNGT